MRWKQKGSIAFLLVCFMVVAAACSGKSTNSPGGGAAGNKVLKVGAPLSLTGTFASEGSGVQKGYQLWQETVNAKGGIQIGSDKYHVNFVFYDDKSEPQTAGKLVEKLIAEDKVDVIFGPYGSDLNLVGSAIAERQGVTFISPMAAADKLYERKFKYFFGANATAAAEVQSYAGVLTALGTIKTVAIIYPDLVYPSAMADYLKKTLEAGGFQVVYYEKYPPGTKDFASILTTVKSKNPDAFFTTAFLQEAMVIGRQIETVQLGAKVNGYAAVTGNPEFVSTVGKGSENALGLGLWDPRFNYKDPLFGDSKQFAELFKQKFNSEPHYYEAAAAGTGVIMQLALNKAGSLDKQKVAAALEAVEAETIFGPVKFNAAHQNEKLKVPIMQLQNGKQEIVWPADKQTAKPTLRK